LRWRQHHIFAKINNERRQSLKQVLGKSKEARAGIVDSQSVKTVEKKGFEDLTQVRKLKAGKDTYWLISLDC
jgi:hypothetical protein